MKPAQFEASPETRLIRQRLRRAMVGDFVSYTELSTLVSKPVSGSFAPLQSAVNTLLRNDSIVFSVVRGEGLKRLNDSEIVAASDGDIDTIRRKAKKAAVKITSVQDYGKLSAAEQLAHTTKLSLFTAFATMSSDRGIKRVEPVATGRSGELPIAETLRAFLAPT